MLNINKKIIVLLIAIFLFVNSLVIQPVRAQDTSEEEKASILDLQNQIQGKTNQINEIKDKISTYRKEIDKLQDEAATLKGHINILDSQINESEDEINLLNNEIQQKELEIKKLALDINVTQQEIDKKLEEIKIILKEINSLDEDYLGNEEAESRGIIDIIIHFFKVIIKYNSWSDYEKTVEDTNTINELLKEKRDKLNDLKTNQEADKKAAEDKTAELNDKKGELENKQQILAGEKTAKKEILSQTQENEAKYEDFLRKELATQNALTQEIVNLKEEYRNKIAALQENVQNINSILGWPVQYRRITTLFHDPTYPFRRYFEHNAIDIACPQGTPIYAPAAGYVTKAGIFSNYGIICFEPKNSGMYSFKDS